MTATSETKENGYRLDWPLIQERNKWRDEFEQGIPIDCAWLNDYRLNRDNDLWRSTRELEKLCEYVLYLENKEKK